MKLLPTEALPVYIISDRGMLFNDTPNHCIRFQLNLGLQEQNHSTLYDAMVDVYQPKKKRGIAGTRTTRVVAEAKPYWPGLEVDDFDREKVSSKTKNTVVNVDASADQNPTSRDEVCENTGNERTKCLPNRTLANEEGHNNAEGFENHRDEQEVNEINDSSQTDIQKSIQNDSTRMFRSRKRRRKEITNAQSDTVDSHIEESTNELSSSDILSVWQKSNDVVASVSITGDPTGSGVDGSNFQTTTALVHDNCPPSSSTPADFKTNGKNENVNVSVSQSIDRNRSDESEPTGSAKSIAPLVSPNNLEEVMTALESTKENAEMTTTRDSGQVVQLMKDESHLRKQADELTLSKFEDICKRQEKFLDRIDGLESAAAKRESEFLSFMRQHKSQESLVSQLKEDIQRLECSNASLSKNLKILQDSKENLQRTFYSRIEEQFRELSKRDAIIEKQNKELRAIRLENERLRKVIEAKSETTLVKTNTISSPSRRQIARSEAAFTSHRNRQRGRW